MHAPQYPTRWRPGAGVAPARAGGGVCEGGGEEGGGGGRTATGRHGERAGGAVGGVDRAGPCRCSTSTAVVVGGEEEGGGWAGGGVTAGLARERARLPVHARPRPRGKDRARRGGEKGAWGGGVCRLQPRGRRVCQNSSTFPQKRSLGRQPAPPPPFLHGAGHGIYSATMHRDEHRLSTERRRSEVQTSASTVRSGLYSTVCTALYENTPVGISNVSSCLEMDQANWIHKWVGGGGARIILVVMRGGQDPRVLAHGRGSVARRFADVVDEDDGGELLRATRALVLAVCRRRLSRLASLPVVATRSLMVVDQVRLPAHRGGWGKTMSPPPRPLPSLPTLLPRTWYLCVGGRVRLPSVTPSSLSSSPFLVLTGHDESRLFQSLPYVTNRPTGRAVSCILLLILSHVGHLHPPFHSLSVDPSGTAPSRYPSSRPQRHARGGGMVVTGLNEVG